MPKLRGSLLALSSAVFALLQGASLPSPGVPEAFAQPARRPKDGSEEDDALLLVPPRLEEPSMLLAHRSHSSHSSHRSHSSHSSGGYVGRGSVDPDEPAPAPPAPPPAPPPNPARVSIMAYPGGRIFVGGKLVGVDSTSTLTLPPGNYTIRVENRFLGDTNQQVSIAEGQTGIVLVQW